MNTNGSTSGASIGNGHSAFASSLNASTANKSFPSCRFHKSLFSESEEAEDGEGVAKTNGVAIIVSDNTSAHSTAPSEASHVDVTYVLRDSDTKSRQSFPSSFQQQRSRNVTLNCSIANETNVGGNNTGFLTLDWLTRNNDALERMKSYIKVCRICYENKHNLLILLVSIFS